MHTSMLRQLWEEIEMMQASVLLRLSDKDLVGQLLCQLDIQHPLSGEESSTVSNYIRERTTLIRDIAEARLTRL